MEPLIAAIYEQLVSPNQTLKKAKSDNSAFTIADGLVQRLIIEVLFSQVSFHGIVGEEDEDDKWSDEKGSWFWVQGLAIPAELRPLVVSTKADMEFLASEYLSQEMGCNYQKTTVFIDPIDGTREFSSGKGEQCSVCIGFANEHGKAIGGVVYRPLPQSQPTWVAGAKSEGYAKFDFGGAIQRNRRDSKVSRGGLLSTNGSISPFIESLIDELGQYERVKSGGAGNKMMMLLESSLCKNDNRSMVYIQDRGVSRWDTCAAEACLEAFGGKLMKLTPFFKSRDDEVGQNVNGRECYTYLVSHTNLDFIPGVANLTKYNCRANTEELKLNQKLFDADQVKPYSNLCGLVAVGKEWNTTDGMIRIKQAIERAAARHPPSFD
ncbi:hypothetical protein ACHAWF_010766 [Thalassiosira exigua]